MGQRDAGHRKGAFKVKFAKGDLIRVQPGRESTYGREAGLYLVLEPGLPSHSSNFLLLLRQRHGHQRDVHDVLAAHRRRRR